QSERVYNLAFELIMSTDPMEKAGYDFGQIPQELFDYALNRFWLHYLGQSQINRTQPLFAMIKVVPERLLDRAIYHGLRAMVFNSSETTLQKLVNSIKGKELYAWEKALDRSIKKKVVESIRGQLMTLRSEFNEVGESDSFKNRRDQQKSNLEFLEAEFSSKGFWGLKLRIECEEKLK
ncbi:MAG: hypothetical protein KDD40_03780, partial [Bdellovibrionales bacterium]|nr:hypothetical protein [Bdellovibrionales bacterium]